MRGSPTTMNWRNQWKWSCG